MPASSKGSAMFQRLKVGPMKRLYKYYTPDAINIAGGVPMDKIFPFREIGVELAGGSSFKIQNASTLSLNYNRGDGIPHLRDWIRNHVQALHSPKKEFNSCVTVGSTDAYAKILMLFNGDTVVFDKFAYGAAVSTCSAFGRHAVGVSTDKDGMIPDSLREQVIRARRRGLKPDLVYLVPTAQNPTGVTMSEVRKREIYKTCCDLDLIIIEDDAYYYLHFENESDSIQKGGIYDISRMPGIDNLPKSLYSMDTEDRVLRIDSLVI
jgi:DNA-binding transcriptional MocR family regulator